MSKLLIRDKSQGWVTFIHSEAEFKEFADNYIPGRRLIIGDVALFTPKMKSRLLKLIEENPILDVYTSVDLQDPTLLSRFVFISKRPLVPITGCEADKFQNSSRSYLDTALYLDNQSVDVKLRAPLVNKQAFKLLLS